MLFSVNFPHQSLLRLLQLRVRSPGRRPAGRRCGEARGQHAIAATDGAANTRHRLDTRRRALAAVRMSQESSRGTANSRINFIHPKDAGGVLVELVEPAEH